MKPLTLIPPNTDVPFMRHRRFALLASSLLGVLSIFLFALLGLNYGIDFRGGTLVEIRTPNTADLTAVRSDIGSLGLGDIEVQSFGGPRDVLIRVEQQPGGEAEQQNAVRTIKDYLGTSVEYRRVEVIGPKVSSELVYSGIMAITLAFLLVLFYLWFRFEWYFGIGAVIALVHDVVLTIGLFAALRLEFNLSIIAAILTIVGYSLNDTVVVYDRVRENLRKFKKLPLVDLLNDSINDTLSRTVLTSVTTLLALLALYIFAGEVIRGFTFAMIWGVIIGTYSSIYIASPILLTLGLKRPDADSSDVLQADTLAAPR